MENLESQLQNNIVMFSRPTYPFLMEMAEYCAWNKGEYLFEQDNKIRSILEAIKLRKDFQKEYLQIRLRNTLCNFWITDIAGNIL